MRTPVRFPRVAIVGSREFERLDLVQQAVRQLGRRVVIVSGGARGVDKTAERTAKRLGYPEPRIFRAAWKVHGKKAGFIRNKKIVAEADGVIAFWDGHSPGTQHTLELAEKAQKPIILVLEAEGDIRMIPKNWDPRKRYVTSSQKQKMTKLIRDRQDAGQYSGEQAAILLTILETRFEEIDDGEASTS